MKTEMKSADWFLENHGVRIFGSQKARIENAMRQYAEHCLDIAAEEAKAVIETLPNQIVDTKPSGIFEPRDRVKYKISVDRDSILSIKERLK